MKISLKFVPEGPTDDKSTLVSGNALMLNWQQTIIACTDVDLDL